MLEPKDAKVKADAVREWFKMELPMPFTVTTVTCETCGLNDICEFAFDHYNIDGDCLADK